MKAYTATIRLRLGARSGRRLAVSLVALLALLGAGCSADPSEGADSPAVATSEVSVADDVFEPEVVEVAPGTEVTWTWAGNNAHNVVGEGFSSETQTSGTFQHSFDEPGTYTYRCTLHPGMAGTVLVREDAGEEAR